MLNKGFKFFGQGSSKKFQLTAQKVPWPFILSRIGEVRKNFILNLTFSDQMLLNKPSLTSPCLNSEDKWKLSQDISLNTYPGSKISRQSFMQRSPLEGFRTSDTDTQRVQPYLWRKSPALIGKRSEFQSVSRGITLVTSVNVMKSRRRNPMKNANGLSSSKSKTSLYGVESTAL